MKRAFKQRVVAKAAQAEGRILLEGEPPGTIACHTLQYTAEIEEFARPTFAVQMYREGRELMDSTVTVVTEEVPFEHDDDGG